MAVHRRGFYFVIVATFLLFLGYVAFNLLSALNLFGITNALLPVHHGSVAEAYPVSFDFSPWFYAVHAFAILWHFFSLCYGLGTLCRHDLSTGGYLYYSPPYIPITMYAMFGMALISQVAWLFAFTYGYASFSLAFLAMTSFALFMSLAFASTRLHQHAPDLARSGQTREIAMVRGLILNGLAVHSSYVDFMVTILLGKVLVYEAGLEDRVAGLIVFGLYLVSIVCFFIVEVSVWDRYARYTMTHYMIGVVGLVSVLLRSLQSGSEFTDVHYLIIANLVAVCFAVIGKMIAACVREGRPGGLIKYGRGTSVIVKK